MLLALVEDLARIEGVRVATTWDSRLGEPPATAGDVEWFVVSGPDEESAAFDRLALMADAVLAVAPETGGELARRCRRAEALGSNWRGCSASAIDLCGDKLRLAEHLAGSGVPTIETHPLTPRTLNSVRLPAVVKPRDGAGSQSTFLVRSWGELRDALREFSGPGTDEPVWQPYVAGPALSVAVLVHERREPDVFPVAAQHLSGDGRFRYLGGAVPAESVPAGAIWDLARAACASVSGLRGYVGVDVMVPEEDDARPVLVEINPRLTTSYLGYRRLTETNLAERWLGGGTAGAIEWAGRRVEYRPDGVVAVDRSLKGGITW